MEMEREEKISINQDEMQGVVVVVVLCCCVALCRCVRACRKNGGVCTILYKKLQLSHTLGMFLFVPDSNYDVFLLQAFSQAIFRRPTNFA